MHTSAIALLSAAVMLAATEPRATSALPESAGYGPHPTLPEPQKKNCCRR